MPDNGEPAAPPWAPPAGVPIIGQKPPAKYPIADMALGIGATLQQLQAHLAGVSQQGSIDPVLLLLWMVTSTNLERHDERLRALEAEMVDLRTRLEAGSSSDAQPTPEDENGPARDPSTQH